MPVYLGRGQKLLEYLLGKTTEGQALFLRKKMKGHRLFLKKKMTGPTLFLTKKMTGQRLFLAEITFTAFLLLMLSCLTLDAECVICLDIV